MDEMDSVLSARDAGHLLGLTPSGVRRLAEAGQLRGFRDSTGRRLFLKRHVEEVARQRCARQRTRPTG